MDNENIPQEEKDLEAEASREAIEEEVRGKVIAEYGFDEVSDAERIDKLTQERMGSHGKLMKAVRQKVELRDKLKAAKPNEQTPPKTVEQQQQAPKVTDADVDKLVTKRMEERDLEDLNLPDDIAKEVKRVAEIQGISVRKAAKDPYIVSRIAEHEKQVKAEEAAITRKNNPTGGGKREFTTTPPEVDMSTEEGRNTHEEWKKWMKEKGY